MRYILLLLVLLVSSFSYAQEDSESVDSENIEEVVTSALRKETALQDTGLAVTVLTASDIESKNLKEFYDFQFNVPGVLFNKGNFSGAAIQIRGMTNYALVVPLLLLQLQDKMTLIWVTFKWLKTNYLILPVSKC